ncbi:MAG: TRAP transporter small permease [Rhodospirillales bacterium]|nr:TRAP transporter small permease [Rhodospirillales bacterium]
MKDKKNRVDATLVFIDRCIHPITLYAGGIALIGLAVLIVTAVIFRYVFNSPIFGTDDFNQIFLMATVAFSVAYSGRKGGQVIVEILSLVTGPRFTRWTDIFVKLLGTLMMCILIWVLIGSGINAAEYGETTRSLEITLQPFFWILAFGMALYAIVLLFELIALLRGYNLE